MTVELSDYAQKFVDEKVSSGACSSATEAIDEAIRDLEARREREETIRAVKQGVADFEAGRIHTVDEAREITRRENPYLNEN